ncbi:MAG TPA: hypothetical protein VK208_21925 [Pyrinomonadaceae bacterium]|jgi:hypothetical protein|nr:hypothetical protein [Pyrinomonadaceae bacterium]
MSTTMSGLRVYINSAGKSEFGTEKGNGVGSGVFYSRRGNGPIYRWLYEEKRAQWRPLRMNTSDLNVHKLSNASWKSVPETLQVQLGSHYLD